MNSSKMSSWCGVANFAKGFVTGVTLMLFSNVSTAAVLHLYEDGQLQGASDVLINGSYYNVEFVDGTCASVYSNCTNLTQDWIFTSLADITVAGQAVLDQVLIDDPSKGYYFDSEPELTNGIDDTFVAIMYMPFVYASATQILVTGLVNYTSLTADYIQSSPGHADFTIPETGTTHSPARYNWVRFSYASDTVAWVDAASSSSVPTPGPLLLLTAGMTGLAFRRRRMPDVKQRN